MTKRILAIVLAMAMLLSVTPIVALAKEQTCSACGGTGFVHEDCETCVGGHVDCHTCHGDAVLDCESCAGAGHIDCASCDDGKVDCGFCVGVGGFDCPDCEGGLIACFECGGDGECDCMNCVGGQVTCPACAGSREMTCPVCAGEGGDCSYCAGDGKVECDECIGVGTVDCDECGGSGSMICPLCDGGTVDCPNCDGGTVDCPNCDGGKTDCLDCAGAGVIDCAACVDGKVDCPDCEDGTEVCADCAGEGGFKVMCPDCFGTGVSNAFGVIINDERAVAGELFASSEEDETETWIIKNVTLGEGDVVVLYDPSLGVGIAGLDPSSVDGVEYVLDPESSFRGYYEVTEAGAYTFFVKLDYNYGVQVCVTAGGDTPVEPEWSPNYSLMLTVEDEVGKAYKATEYSDPIAEVALPDGLSYANGEWTMENFNYISMGTRTIIFDGDAVLNLVGENTVCAVSSGPYKDYILGVEVDGDLTIQGDGSLDISAGGANESYVMYIDGMLTLKEGTLTVNTDDSNGGYAVDADIINVCGGELNANAANFYNNTAIYSSRFFVSAGDVHVTTGEVFYSNYGIYTDGEMAVSGGNVTVNVGDTEEDAYGIYEDEGNLNISGGNVTVTVNAPDAEYGSYGVYGLKTLTGGVLTASADSYAVGWGEISTFTAVVSEVKEPTEEDKIEVIIGTPSVFSMAKWIQMKPLTGALFLAQDGTIHLDTADGKDLTGELAWAIQYDAGAWTLCDLSFGTMADTAIIFEEEAPNVTLAGYCNIVAGKNVFNRTLTDFYNEEEVAVWVANSADGTGSEPYSTDWTAYRWINTISPRYQTVYLRWYDSTGSQITGEGVPTEVKVDAGEVASIVASRIYQNDLEEFINDQKILRWRIGYNQLVNASDIPMEIVRDCWNEKTVSLYAVTDDGYTYDGNMAYRKDFESGFADYANHPQCFDIKTYYNNRWIGTTYDSAYAIHNDLGENAVVTDEIQIVDGQYAQIAITVTANGGALSGHVGVFADVMVGDNDSAAVTAIKEGDNVVGFQITDDHTDCSSMNAQLQCYVSGSASGKLGQTMRSSGIDVADGWTQEATCWFGPYDDADENWLNDKTDTVEGMDSGFATSWAVELEDGASRTFYMLVGVVNAAVNEAPRFISKPLVPQFDGEEIKDSGFVSVNIANEVEAGANGGNMALVCTTKDGQTLQVTPQALGAARKSYYDDPEEKLDNDQVAVFDKAQINAYPGTYFIVSLTAQNAGGKTATYDLTKEEKIVIPATPRERPLVIGAEDETENRKEGWAYDEEKGELTVHGLDIQSTAEGEAAVQMPAGTDIVVDPVVGEAGGLSTNKVSSVANGIDIDAGEEPVEIAGEGKLEIIAGETGIDAADNDLTMNADTTMTAKTGIKTDADVTIGNNLTINSTECGIDCDTLTITEGALTINYEGGVALNVNKLIVPEGYEVIGGTIDEEGNFTPDEDATQLIIRKTQQTITYTGDNVTFTDKFYGETAATAGQGDTISFRVEPDEGYLLKNVTAATATGEDVALTIQNGVYSFVMPDSNVTVKAVAHAHNLVEVEGLAATEETAGYKAYYECKDSDDACGALFEDAEGKTPIDDLAAWKAEGGNGYIAPLPHTHVITPVEGKAAAEGEAGYKGYFVCAGCETYFEDAEGKTPIDDLAAWKAEGGNGYIAPLPVETLTAADFEGNAVEQGPDTYEIKEDGVYVYGDEIKFSGETDKPFILDNESQELYLKDITIKGDLVFEDMTDTIVLHLENAAVEGNVTAAGDTEEVYLCAFIEGDNVIAGDVTSVGALTVYGRDEATLSAKSFKAETLLVLDGLRIENVNEDYVFGETAALTPADESKPILLTVKKEAIFPTEEEFVINEGKPFEVGEELNIPLPTVCDENGEPLDPQPELKVVYYRVNEDDFSFEQVDGVPTEEGEYCAMFFISESDPNYTGSASYDFSIAGPSVLLGDVNDDGLVNMKDLLRLRKVLAGFDVEYNFLNSDVNVDEEANMKDVLYIREYLASLITEFGPQLQD